MYDKIKMTLCISQNDQMLCMLQRIYLTVYVWHKLVRLEEDNYNVCFGLAQIFL